ncbi:hypothetical protein Y032_0207g2020 [Ancylostoma ceylanicum]|uniref:Uncharacterized protein n=1 Tax=Ancylostoma ceylanicum TaxID=53326 RepID=A0A016SLW1_9BILA|nr:hypothetical protein Y032_0207g2020 [Ancylostoma ceylanicum]
MSQHRQQTASKPLKLSSQPIFYVKLNPHQLMKVQTRVLCQRHVGFLYHCNVGTYSSVTHVHELKRKSKKMIAT